MTRHDRDTIRPSSSHTHRPPWLFPRYRSGMSRGTIQHRLALASMRVQASGRLSPYVCNPLPRCLSAPPLWLSVRKRRDTVRPVGVPARPSWSVSQADSVSAGKQGLGEGKKLHHRVCTTPNNKRPVEDVGHHPQWQEGGKTLQQPLDCLEARRGMDGPERPKGQRAGRNVFSFDLCRISAWIKKMWKGGGRALAWHQGLEASCRFPSLLSFWRIRDLDAHRGRAQSIS